MRPTLLILDACVLIDFAKTDPTLLKLIVAHVGPIHVPSPVLAEVKQLDESAAASLNMRIVEPDLAMAIEAANLGGPLSFEDRLCLMMAKANGWTCVSNDGCLRRACESDSVPILWGLELLLGLVTAGGVPKPDAEAAAWAIHRSNPKFVTRKIVLGFVQKLGRIK